MAEKPQSYANHRRWFILYHYIALPILAINCVLALAHLVRRPTLWNAWLVVLAVGLVAGLVASRASTLIVQNRVIGLEMRLRLATTLPADLRSRIPELKLRQLVALRFAGDDELVGLVERCLHGELETADAIKRAVRDWRPDFVRA
jgi:hypothetical protein